MDTIAEQTRLPVDIDAQPLVREEVGGRTTCWSPARQKLR